MENRKVQKDYKEEVAVQLPLVVNPAKNDVSKLPKALEDLLALEKKTRLANDLDSSKVIAKALMELIIHHKDWKLLGEHISLICKRHAQMKQVVTEVIRAGVGAFDLLPSDAARKELIETMREVSQGKMHVELEYARMSRTLAKILEKEGDIEKASSILQDIQIETLGSMEFDEKIDYILEQLRSTMAANNFIRAELVHKKIQPAKLDEDKEKLADLKQKYYDLLIQFHKHNKSYLDISKAFLDKFLTKRLQESADAWKAPLKSATLFAALAPFDSDVADLRQRLLAQKKIKELPSCQELLKLLTTDRIVSWPMPFDSEFKQDVVFNEEKEQDIERYDALKKSVVQHNLRVISQYYKQIRSKRLEELLELSTEDTEKYLSEMVQSKQLFARIDRPAGIINFRPQQNADDVLNVWAGNISTLLSKIDIVCHQVAKENMLHGVS